ncbi:MAG: hypothetical protein ACRDVE_11335 [Actinocrinis sp.]
MSTYWQTTIAPAIASSSTFAGIAARRRRRSSIQMLLARDPMAGAQLAALPDRGRCAGEAVTVQVKGHSGVRAGCAGYRTAWNRELAA